MGIIADKTRLGYTAFRIRGFRETVMRIKSFLSRSGLILFAFLMVVSYREVEGSATKLLDNGGSSDHIDLLFISSGYTSEELDIYRRSVDGNVGKMLSVNWFAANNNLFNVCELTPHRAVR
jgi:hypothetical protein